MRRFKDIPIEERRRLFFAPMSQEEEEQNEIAIKQGNSIIAYNLLLDTDTKAASEYLKAVRAEVEDSIIIELYRIDSQAVAAQSANVIPMNTFEGTVNNVKISFLRNNEDMFILWGVENVCGQRNQIPIRKYSRCFELSVCVKKWDNVKANVTIRYLVWNTRRYSIEHTDNCNIYKVIGLKYQEILNIDYPCIMIIETK